MGLSTPKTEPQITIQLRKAAFGGSGVRPRHIIGAATESSESFTSRNNSSYQCLISALCTACLLAFALRSVASSPLGQAVGWGDVVLASAPRDGVHQDRCGMGSESSARE